MATMGIYGTFRPNSRVCLRASMTPSMGIYGAFMDGPGYRSSEPEQWRARKSRAPTHAAHTYGRFLEDFSKVRASANAHLRRVRFRTFGEFAGILRRCAPAGSCSRIFPRPPCPPYEGGRWPRGRCAGAQKNRGHLRNGWASSGDSSRIYRRRSIGALSAFEHLRAPSTDSRGFHESVQQIGFTKQLLA
jgi:hypothetical protein